MALHDDTLVRFYRNQRTDSEGRFLKELWSWRDQQLEQVHNYIQWMFPLPEGSQVNRTTSCSR